MVEVHADQAWTINEADPGYAGLHRQLTTNNIDNHWANACSESMHPFIRSFVRSFVRSFIRSFIHSFTLQGRWAKHDHLTDILS